MTRTFADAPDEPRAPDHTEQTFPEMVRPRVYDILTSYENQSDHDSLSRGVGDASPCADDLR